MKIKRSVLAKIVAEEIKRRVNELAEADDDSKKKSKKPQMASADQEPTQQQDNPEVNAGPKPAGASPGDPPEDAGMDSGDESEEGPEKDALDVDGDASDNPSGAINNEVSGKSIQAVTIEPESKVLPGSKEVVLTFSQTSDPLRILVTATGQVKFFWRGQLADLP